MNIKFIKNNTNEEFKILRQFISYYNSTNSNYSNDFDITKIILLYNYQISDVYSFINQNLNTSEGIEGVDIFKKINMENDKKNIQYDYK